MEYMASRRLCVLDTEPPDGVGVSDSDDVYIVALVKAI